MKRVFCSFIFFSITLKSVYSECDCEKIKRNFGTTAKTGICFNTNFTTTIRYPVTRNMVRIKGGLFHIGTDNPILTSDGEGPRRPVQLDDYYLDKYEVSIMDFAKFIDSTGYETDADKYGDSFILYSLAKNSRINRRVLASAVVPWWIQNNATNWAHPDGPNSTVADRLHHPVVHVSWNDATTYCSWLGKRLPTEAEWEVACRGSLEDKLFAWGDDFLIDGKHQANTWQGFFPYRNTAEDGYVSTAPVERFLQNDYGFYNIIGNAWEWTNDWWTNNHTKELANNPKGPETGKNKVMKGGSCMCCKDYCYRYRCAARTSNSLDSSSGHIGFRCAKSAVN